MIGTIRKHSGWLWMIIIAATVVSFVFYFAPSSRMGGGGGSMTGDFGSIYGKKITPQAYSEARNEFYLYYFLHYHEWPDKNPNLSKDDLEREIYIRLLLTQKTDNLGISVGADAAATLANETLHSPELARALGIEGQDVPLDFFVRQVLQPEGLTVADFERFVRHNIAIHQLALLADIPGTLVTPQEAADAYVREHQEFSAQIVFFSASNYLSQVAVTPQAVQQFYTNYLAEYRLPDRVQVSYVEFNVTNFFAQSKAEWAKTNFNDQIDAIYDQYGSQAFPDAKTPDEAKAKIRELLIRQRALAAARLQANAFAEAVFSVDPPRAENLAAVAKQKGLTVKVTAPFTADAGPTEFTAPEEFTKSAFGLTTDEPFAGPIVGPDGVYVIALDKQLPSEIPPFAEIHDRVTRDFQMQQAIALAQRAGTNFVFTLKISMAAKSSFASACLAAGLKPEILPPFSLSTRELPELGDRANLNEIKQVAFTTPVGDTSGFEPTDDGGFILFVQSQLPVDQSAMAADLPQFTADLRISRESDAFNEWLSSEANRELRDTPIFKKEAAANIEK
jgi:peptidyl-prolyl cis-trans isomerase D